MLRVSFHLHFISVPFSTYKRRNVLKRPDELRPFQPYLKHKNVEETQENKVIAAIYNLRYVKTFKRKRDMVD